MTHLQSLEPSTLTRIGESSTRHCRLTVPTVGGVLEIDADGPVPAGAQSEIGRAAQTFEHTADLFADMSTSGAGRFDFPAQTQRLFALCDALAAATHGDLRHSWVLDIHRSGSTVTTHQPVTIDIGAAGTGHLVDSIADTLHRAEVDEFVIDAGNTMRHSGSSPMPVALRHPHDPTLAVGVTTLADQALGTASAVAGSAAVTATWVVAADSATAAALADALLSTSPTRLARYFHFSYIRLLNDGHAEISRNFPGALFTKDR